MMKEKVKASLYPLSFGLIVLLIWWIVCMMELAPTYMLPSPSEVLMSLFENRNILIGHAAISLQEAGFGLGLSIITSFFLAVTMDRFTLFRRFIYPVVVLTQTIPVIAIAPLLVLWLGYGMLPKVILIFIVCFFPLTTGILTGLSSVDPDQIALFESMGASHFEILKEVKIPLALPNFFSALRVAVAYAIVGAVIAEWLGGSGGLGVYMTRVRKSYAYDDMFAVIFLVSVISLILIKGIDVLERKVMPWKRRK